MDVILTHNSSLEDATKLKFVSFCSSWGALSYMYMYSLFENSRFTLLLLPPHTHTATPKFTLTPADLDLAVDTSATISCAFNGCPAPCVVWSKDSAEVASDSRHKITSCPTSSVLEVAQLEHEDEGVYSCSVTNSVGEDCTSMLLSIHGEELSCDCHVICK